MKTSRAKHINYEMTESKLKSPIKLVKYVIVSFALWKFKIACGQNCCCL